MDLTPKKKISAPELYRRIANYLEEGSRFEREMEPKRVRLPDQLDTCEACEKKFKGGGLCADCLYIAAGAARIRSTQVK